MNADTSVRVAIDTNTVPWTRLAEGAYEKVLEDDDRRRTSIVHVVKGRLPVADRGGSVELFVLAGSAGEYGLGTYLRDIVPTELTDAVLLVKQRPSVGAPPVAVRAPELAYSGTLVTQARVAEDHAGGVVALIRFAPDSMIPDHGHRSMVPSPTSTAHIRASGGCANRPTRAMLSPAPAAARS